MGFSRRVQSPLLSSAVPEPTAIPLYPRNGVGRPHLMPGSSCRNERESSGESVLRALGCGGGSGAVLLGRHGSLAVLLSGYGAVELCFVEALVKLEARLAEARALGGDV